ncbi:fimbrial protein [Escherichia coli]
MKKTLIALAVAASAAVSGSAMAWTANGTGGSVELGGTVNVLSPNSPWEVKVGDAVNNLNAEIHSGDKKVVIPANREIPILGIRTVSNVPFHGQNGISPQIDFGKAVNIDSFQNGRADLTLDVKNDSDVKIGTLTTIFTSGAEGSTSNGQISSKFNLFAANPGDAFYGGLGKSNDKISNEGWYIAHLFGAEYVQNYNDQNGTFVAEGNHEFFNNSQFTYSAVYAAGILDNANITITLEQPATSNITWKASLPVSVTYQ